MFTSGEGLLTPSQSEAVLTGEFERGLMTRALAALFAAGATLALLTLALAHSRRASDLGLLAIVGNAYLVAAVLCWRARSLPTRVLPLALLWGSTLIAGVAYFSGQSPSPLVFFYLWVFLYASYFFTTTETAVQIVYVGLAYGALLALRPPAGGVAEWWLVGMGALVVAAILIRSMRARVESLIARLYDAARVDPLTKLSNRSGFREQLDLEIERARRSNSDMSIIVGDIDHFKELNDRAGSNVGDLILKRLADVLGESGRQLDTLARVGGDEFALLLPGTGGHDALLVAERLRDQLRNEFDTDLIGVTVIRLTMSFGVASFPEHGETAGSLLRAADQAVYAAKQSGCDRSVLHSQALLAVPRADGQPRDIAAERFLAVVLDLAEAVDLRFSGTARHSETVGRYAAMMAKQLGFSAQSVERIKLAGMLHDVGKVGVPDSILNKPTKLTDGEFQIIKTHPQLGAQILEHSSLADIRAWVGAHHERPDGRGYPRGLSGEQLPLEAGILAVADAYEAMTSDRAYRSSIGPVAAQAELERCIGTQFDASVVKALLTALDREARRAQAALTAV
jgi:diguanylate cyclase (GGDEF)-like protein/putative nucleotidyltransferase with HDIG domain